MVYTSPGLNELNYPVKYNRTLVRVTGLKKFSKDRLITILSEQKKILFESDSPLEGIEFMLELADKRRIEYRIYGQREIQKLEDMFQAMGVEDLRKKLNSKRVWVYFDKGKEESVRGIKIEG